MLRVTFYTVSIEEEIEHSVAYPTRRAAMAARSGLEYPD